MGPWIFLLFAFIAFSADELELVPGMRDPPRGMRVKIQVKAEDLSDQFETIYYDVRCAPTLIRALSSEPVSSLTECKRKCSSNPKCGFIAYWKKGWCETYFNCDATTNIDDKGRPLKNVQVLKRLTRCEADIGISSDGRYMKAISSAFPDGIVRLQSPRRNINCVCVTDRWAICGIFVMEGTEEANAVMQKLNPTRPEPPFCLLASLIVFSIDDESICQDQNAAPMRQRVFAEMEVMSSFACIHVTICTDGTPNAACPVTKKPFKPGDPVYILNDDIERMNNLEAVPCISKKGMMKLGMTMSDQGSRSSVSYRPFEDPLGRRSGDRLWARRDYSLFWIFNEDFLDTGICREWMMANVKDQGAEPALPDPSVSEGSTSKGGKKRRGGKKHTKSKIREDSGSPQSGPSASSGDPITSSPGSSELSAVQERQRSTSVEGLRRNEAGPSDASLLMGSRRVVPGYEPFERAGSSSGIIATAPPTKSTTEKKDRSFLTEEERQRRKKNRARRGVPAEISSLTDVPPSSSGDPKVPAFFDPSSIRFQKLDLQRQGSDSSSGSYKTADEEVPSETFLASFLQAPSDSALPIIIIILFVIFITCFTFTKASHPSPNDFYIEFNDDLTAVF